jgi:hypothetical protein
MPSNDYTIAEVRKRTEELSASLERTINSFAHDTGLYLWIQIERDSISIEDGSEIVKYRVNIETIIGKGEA